MEKPQNIFQMYMNNGYKFGFYVHRNSWRSDRYAMVVGIDGVEEGSPIEGEPPYFNRYYPNDHPKAGKTWSRNLYLEAAWFDNGRYETGSGGTYGWTLINLNE
jgi:hypothetical protein